MPIIAGQATRLSEDLRVLLPPDSAPGLRLLVNTDSDPELSDVAARCRSFADASPGEALLITILYAAAPGLAMFSRHAANAALWAFTRQAALEWAPRRIRVNAIGLGASPADPDGAQEQSGRAAADMPAEPASAEDIARTIRAMAAWPSMTGQLVRLGALVKRA